MIVMAAPAIYRDSMQCHPGDVMIPNLLGNVFSLGFTKGFSWNGNMFLY